MIKKELSLYSPRFKPAPPSNSAFWIDFKFPLDFSIIGAPKSGTTWLYHCLAQHPDVFVAGELNYFTGRQNRGKEYYYSFFKDAGQSSVVGDYSNTYMLDENLPEVFYSLNPNMKIVICCRNPVERAFSHYLMDVRKGTINPKQISFHDALVHPQKYSYFDFGLYYKHISKYLRYIKRENLLAVTLDEIKASPRETVNRVLDFLGVNPSNSSSTLFQAINSWEKNRILRREIGKSDLTLGAVSFFRTYLPKSVYEKLKKYIFQWASGVKPTIPREVGMLLADFYYDENRKLEALLDRDLSSWNYS